MRRPLARMLLGATLIAGTATTACAVRERYYDHDRDDWHRWDNREDREYHRYLSENHRDNREFRDLSDQEKQDYWKWRHQSEGAAR